VDKCTFLKFQQIVRQKHASGRGVDVAEPSIGAATRLKTASYMRNSSAPLCVLFSQAILHNSVVE